MVLLYLLIGFLTTIFAAIPPGAANVSVVNNTLQNNFIKVRKLIIGAGIGEIAIAYTSLHFTMSLTHYFEENPWVQISIFTLFMIIGSVLLLRKKLPKPSVISIKQPITTPSIIKGFLLAFINPPVLVFWVLAFTLIHRYVLEVSEMSPLETLLLFFLGIFVGKITTLYGYSLWGKNLQRKKTASKETLYRFVGIALLVLGTFQSIRFMIA